MVFKNFVVLNRARVQGVQCHVPTPKRDMCKGFWEGLKS